MTVELITEKEIDLAALMKLGRHAASGALVLFSGDVRNRNKGKDVTRLEYEAHKELAEKAIREIVAAAVEKWSLNFACCTHRIGVLNPTDCAVAVLTSAAHRAEAYQANQYVIDRVKREAPIWKREFYADGSSTWDEPRQTE